MEAMQYLKEKVEKKKEVLHHIKDDVEEMIEEALVSRRSRRSNDAANGNTTTTTVSGDESSIQSSCAGAGCDYKIVDISLDAEMERAAVEEVDDTHEDKSKTSVYLDESAGASQEGSHLEKIPKVETVSAKLKDVDIQKVLSAVINGKDVEILQESLSNGSTLPTSAKPREEDGTSVGSIKNETEHLKIDLVDEGGEEVIELEFERAVEKMHTHEYNMYCPNCSNRITKVVLHRKKRPKRTQPQDLLGCLSCFSIFIPKGNLLNPFKIFGSLNPPESSQIRQGRQPLLAPGSTVQQKHAPGGSDIGRGLPWTPGKLTVNGDASSAQQPSPPVDASSQPAKGTPATPNEALAGNNVDGTAGTSNGVSSVDGSISKGNVIVDIPDKLDGTTQGTRSPMKPISEIEEGLNVINGQYPGGGVQFPPVQGPVPTEPTQITEDLMNTGTPGIAKEIRSSKPVEILKSIVYGGLMELIASLSIVSSAAASDATTLNIVALGVANLIGGLIVLFHNLKDLRYEESNETNGEVKSRYQVLLGRKENFLLHTFFAVPSYIVFGLIPPVVYGFTFRETDDRNFKLYAVAASSLVGVVLLAIAKACTRGQHKFLSYTKTLLYYVTCAVMASGIAYGVGISVERLMVRLGWFDSNPVQHLLIPENKTWASV